MMAGDAILGAALGLALAAALSSFLGGGTMERLARVCTALFAASVAAASGLLMWMILSDRFDIAYVAAYSSRELAMAYKVSSFWAGQQGSFLLWLLIHGLAGCVLASRVGSVGQGEDRDIRRSALGVFSIISALLAILVLAKSPFAPQEPAVLNGAGLNPLLQDPWMAVHPPVIFIGYALLAVPLAGSLGALLINPCSRTWLATARRWCLVAWAFLGAGIFIGGYWAYKVLGWGGYWGWDPVENSSLVPWLAAAVLLHVLRAAQVRETILPVAHLAAIFCFSLVLYGTFLTRSGVLGDFSVHSFSGTSVGLAIALVNATVLLGGLILLTMRAGRFPEGRMYEGYGSREFILLLGMLLAAFIAGLVFIGMSMPLLTQMAGHPAAVDSSFYIRTTLPPTICMMLAMAMACLRLYGAGRTLRAGILPLAGLAVGAIMPLAVGIREALPVILSAVSMMAVAASIQSRRRGALGASGLVAHAGAGIALAAMVLAGTGSRSETLELSPGEAHDILGHEIVYRGQEFAGDGLSKYYVYSVDGREARALTKLRVNGSDAAREPAIERTFTGDVYIAPTPPDGYSVEERFLGIREISLGEGTAYIFEELEVTPDEGSSGRQTVEARIAVTDGVTEEVVTASIQMTADGGTSTPVSVLDGKQRIRLTGVSADRKRIRIEILPSEEEAASVPVTATVSKKPWIWTLWLGAAMVTIGCLAAARAKRA